MSPRQARLAIVIWLVLTVVALTTPTVQAPSARPDAGDSATFDRIVNRLRVGGRYYETMGAELREHGYPTAHIFNWRTPFLMTTLAALPRAVSQSLLVGIGLTLIVCTWRILRGTSFAAACAGLVLETGAVAIAVIPPSLGMAEAWAGLLIGLSVCAFTTGRRTAAIALGTLALFVRELAGAYCLGCTLIALWKRQWRDVAGWGIAGALYAVYYGMHVLRVIAYRQPGDIAHTGSWIALGGVPFLVSTLGWHAWLVLLPPVLARLALPLVVSALWSRQMALEGRAAVAVYLLLFLVAGQPFDVYWGAMAWPVWAIGCGYAVEAVREAARAAVPARAGTATA